MQDLFPVVEAQVHPSEAVIGIYRFAGYDSVTILEVHAKAFLWYIFVSYETTKTTLSYWRTIRVLSPFPILPLGSVVSVVLIDIGIVASGSVLRLA